MGETEMIRLLKSKAFWFGVWNGFTCAKYLLRINK